jgi:hypothetical protein
VRGVDFAELNFPDALAAMREGFRQERVTLGIATDLLGQAGTISVREAQTIWDALLTIAFEMLPPFSRSRTSSKSSKPRGRSRSGRSGTSATSCGDT